MSSTFIQNCYSHRGLYINISRNKVGGAFKICSGLNPNHRNPNLIALWYNPGNSIFKYLTKDFFSGATLLIFFFLLFSFWQLLSTFKGPGSLSHIQVQVWSLCIRETTYNSKFFHHKPLSMKRQGGDWEYFFLTGLASLCWQGAPGELAFRHARNGMQYGPWH